MFEQNTASFIAGATAAISASIVDIAVRLWNPALKLTAPWPSSCTMTSTCRNRVVAPVSVGVRLEVEPSVLVDDAKIGSAGRVP